MFERRVIFEMEVILKRKGIKKWGYYERFKVVYRSFIVDNFGGVIWKKCLWVWNMMFFVYGIVIIGVIDWIFKFIVKFDVFYDRGDVGECE